MVVLPNHSIPDNNWSLCHRLTVDYGLPVISMPKVTLRKLHDFNMLQL